MRAPACGRRWYAANTLPNREALASSQLLRQGFEVYFPKRRKTVRHARRTHERIVSFFPGYLFVSMDLSVDRWRSVNGTIGVRALVMDSERPLPVPAGIVENLREMTDELGFLHRVEKLQPGDRVKVLDGPLADMIGTIERLDGNHRARVLLEMLHGKIPAVLERIVLSGMTI